MRHYDRTDLRHLNDSERYRDYDYVADDGWPTTPEPLSMLEPPVRKAEAKVQVLESPPMWRLVLAAFLHPRVTIRRALGRRSPA